VERLAIENEHQDTIRLQKELRAASAKKHKWWATRRDEPSADRIFWLHALPFGLKGDGPIIQQEGHLNNQKMMKVAPREACERLVRSEPTWCTKGAGWGAKYCIPAYTHELYSAPVGLQSWPASSQEAMDRQC